MSVLNRDRGNALGLISDLPAKGYTLLDVFDVLSGSQRMIGEMWAKGTITVADEHFATEVTLDAIEMASGKMKVFRREKKGSALLANFVEGEFHTIGLKMFAELLRSDGWEVEFYTSSLSVSQIFKYLQKSQKRFELICLSLTMQFNLEEFAGTLKILRTNLLTKDCTIIAGSDLFKTKRARGSLIDKETGRPLLDFIATSLGEGLKFVQSMHSRAARM